MDTCTAASLQAECKITAGHWPISNHFSKNGRSKFQHGAFTLCAWPIKFKKNWQNGRPFQISTQYSRAFLNQTSSGESRQSAKEEIYFRGQSHIMTTSLLCPGLLRRCMVTDLTGMCGMCARPYIVCWCGCSESVDVMGLCCVWGLSAVQTFGYAPLMALEWYVIVCIGLG